MHDCPCEIWKCAKPQPPTPPPPKPSISASEIVVPIIVLILVVALILLACWKCRHRRYTSLSGLPNDGIELQETIRNPANASTTTLTTSAEVHGNEWPLYLGFNHDQLISDPPPPASENSIIRPSANSAANANFSLTSEDERETPSAPLKESSTEGSMGSSETLRCKAFHFKRAQYNLMS